MEQITLEGAATGNGLNDSNDLPEGDERREQITGGTGGGTSTRQGGEPRWMREALLRGAALPPDHQRGNCRDKRNAASC